MPQLDYNDQNAIPAVKGGLADSAFHDIVGGNAAVDINFGYGLAVTAVEGVVALPAAAGFIFAGVAVQSLKDIPRSTGVALYEADEEFPILRKGRIWVYSEQAVNPTLAVFLRHTVNATLVPGDFRVDIDTANAQDISAFAKWRSTTTAAGLAILEVNAP